MEQIIGATQIVKPSSPTPLASKIHKLSSIDQVAPPAYLTLIFFYKNEESEQQEEIFRRLKQSLSEILTIFYPLAGTMTPNSFVDCNDRGAEFVEARVHTRLAQIIQNPKMEELKQLVPCDSSSYSVSASQLLVKASYFDCRGIAVGVCFSHRIGDTACLASFMNAWAAACRGEVSGIIHPSFDLALHFPPRDSPPTAGFSQGVWKEKIVTKRLVFDREKLEEMKKEGGGVEVDKPSSVEALSAFIWRSFIQANKGRGETTTAAFGASHMVNLRARAVPPLPENTFGNCSGMVSAAVSSSSEGDLALLVSKLRAAIRGVDGDCINRVFKEGNDELELGDLFEMGNCVFTSWWRFPFYDVDFGWGKPVWVCTTHMPYMNTTILMSTPSRDGIEAWINIPNNHFFQFIQPNYNKLLLS